ncbi:hypothetical protein AAG906_020727 [Vitis piasezkii]
MEDMECLKSLDLSGTCIKELPSSIEFLKHLADLLKCENLKSLSSSICRLKYLEELCLFGCSNLETFPEIMEDMECLRSLDLSGTCIKELPSSIEFLKHLADLRLVKCENLKSLPSSICRLFQIMEDMECLKSLDLSGACIKELPSSIEFLKHLVDLPLVKCENLRSLPSSICRLKYLKRLNLYGCSNLETFPKIMEDMECLKSLDLSGTCIKELPSSIDGACIKELPSHDCPIFGTLSNPSTLWSFLLKWFKTVKITTSLDLDFCLHHQSKEISLSLKFDEGQYAYDVIFLEVQLDGYWPAEFGMDSTGNELALGYTIGNPITDHFSDFNSRIAYTHQVGILSDELYEVIIPPTHSGQYLKAKVDGGFGRDMLEFLLKGHVVAYRTMVTRFGICNGLSSTILISSTIGICPMWAGDDLHKLVASNVEKLGNFLEGFSEEYFRVLGDGESKDSKTFEGYKSILTSKIIEDSLPELRIVDEKNMEEEHKVVLSGKAGEVDYLHSLHGQIGKPKANVFTCFTR